MAPVAAHFGWNWAETNIFGVFPNPGVDPFGSLIDFELVGAGLWGGSTEGLNASIASSFSLVALCLIVYFVRLWPKGDMVEP